MELRHLRYFVTLADVLHFGRAAAQLRITQPSLSHQIRQLETELKVTLLRRTKRLVQLTAPGRLFLEEAREILAHADAAAVIARRAEVGETGRLVVGFAHWMNVTEMVLAIKLFHKRQPAITFDLRNMSVPRQILALRDGHVDVGFVRPPLNEPWLSSEPITSEPFVVALPRNHALARNRRIAVSALANQPFILIPREQLPVFYDLTLKLCRETGFIPHVRDQVDDPESVLGLVAAGVGISLVPQSARNTSRPGVIFRSLEPSLEVLQTIAAWRRESTSPLVNTFLEIVREVTRPRQKSHHTD